jgi:hypothetical protein
METRKITGKERHPRGKEEVNNKTDHKDIGWEWTGFMWLKIEETGWSI